MPSSRTDKNLTKTQNAATDSATSNGASANGASVNGQAPREYSQDASTRDKAPARGARRLLKIADNYLFWQMVSSTLRGLIWFGGLLILVSSINVLRKGLQQSLPLDAMLSALLYQMPRVFQFSMPMSLLFGTVQTFSDLSSKGEITALWAGGMGLKRMLRAPLLWGAILAVSSFLVQEYVVPSSEVRSARVFEERVKSSLQTQQNFRYFDPLPGKGPLKLMIQAERFDAKTNALIRPRVQLFNTDGSQKMTIDAERGWGDEKTGLWRFSKAIVRTFTTGKGGDAGASVEDHVDMIENNLDGYGSVTAIRQAADLRSMHLARGDFEMISLADLLAYRSALQAQGGAHPADSTRRLISGTTYGIHDKIATPLVCLALILVGAALGVRPQRASAGFAPGLSFLVIGAYYMLWTMASYGGKDGNFNPLMAAYVAFFATASVGAFLVWKKNR